jgi:hypothetical protein
VKYDRGMYPRSTKRYNLHASIWNLVQVVTFCSLRYCLEIKALRQCKHLRLVRIIDPGCSEVYRPACGGWPRPGLSANSVFGFENKNRKAGSMDTTCSLKAAESCSYDDHIYIIQHLGSSALWLVMLVYREEVVC